MRAVALTLRREDGRIVCESVRVADTIGRRMWGLLGRSGLAADEGMLLRPAWSIHTAFMRFPIDVVFIDPEQIVIRIEHRLRPFKTASCRGAREVVELAAGECVRRGLEVGDRVAWASRTVVDELSTESALGAASPRACVVVASDDARFTKLASFLLDSRGIDVSADVPPSELRHALTDETVDGVILDAGSRIADALRLSNSARADRPDVSIVIVGEHGAGGALEGVEVFDKWEHVGDAISALESDIAVRSG